MSLQQGSKGAEVKKLQTRLNELGYRNNGAFLAEDGSFGPATLFAVNAFKDRVIPGGNVGEWWGVVGETTWDALATAEVVLNGADFWLPPHEYNEGGRPWTIDDKQAFISFEGGDKLLWNGCTERLRTAKSLFEDACKKRGWTVRYTSAYRPLVYQAHFYDIYKGYASKTAIGKIHCQKHGIKTASYPRKSSSPHILGIAFDAVVSDASGKQLNPGGGVSAELVKVAGECGLRINTPNDNVHFQLV